MTAIVSGVIKEPRLGDSFIPSEPYICTNAILVRTLPSSVLRLVKEDPVATCKSGCDEVMGMASTCNPYHFTSLRTIIGRNNV